ncbi:o-succinylbenzoate--CoA ligase [Shewanella sp. AS1]|uniref:o-succinylbenzoate--CoA ligase n=1 Tax=Shewanella sp. AS1 TaxID=2907626 RepID=UPI001F2BFA11|nr:o-succinylbenzoate--CoA ligase [Shewanella sp. AS1]MCE9680127.1 o-succinylbenzoate--CoA ligase [Shewanella sp. AS1]
MSVIRSPLHQAASEAPKAIALFEWQEQWQEGAYLAITYAQLSAAVTKLAEQLKQAGLKTGDILTCIDNNSRAMISLYWACIDIGAIFCPLSPRFPKLQISQLAQRYGLNTFWAADEFSSLLPKAGLQLDFSAPATTATTATTYDAASTNTLDPKLAANIILTSGSSGQPKAAVHCLANHIASAQGSASLIPLEQGDNWLLSLPLFHIGGLAIVNRCALAKAAITLPSPSLSLIEQLRVVPLTHLSLVATQLMRIMDKDKAALSGIKSLLLGGGAIAGSLLDKLTSLNLNAYTSYGMTEMSSQITTGLATAKGSSGKLLPHRELRIDAKRILVRGETLFMGYLSDHGGLSFNLPLNQDNWFDTKDLGYWDEEGNLVIGGRADNMFVCGGENVQPEEIEAALKRHPQIQDAIVFAMEDKEFGCLPVAIIKGELSSTEELDAFVCQYIARFKRPRRYFPWPETASTGLKVIRKQLIDAVLQADNSDT